MPAISADDSIYDSAVILSATANIPSAPTFLKQSLFAVDETTTADSVIIDSYRGSNKLAPFVASRKRGIKVTREPIATTFSYTPPRIAPVKDLRADDLMRRTPGEAAYTMKTGVEREGYWMALDFRGPRHPHFTADRMDGFAAAVHRENHRLRRRRQEGDLRNQLRHARVCHGCGEMGPADG